MIRQTQIVHRFRFLTGAQRGPVVRSICCCVMTVIIVGCSATPSRAADNENTSVLAGRTALLETCEAPADRGFGAILLAIGKVVVPKLFNVGMGWAEAKLQQKAESYQATVTSGTAGVFYNVLDAEEKEIAPSYECIAIAYGSVVRDNSPVVPDTGYPEALGLSAAPNVYLELQLHYQLEGGRIFARLSPIRFEFNAPMSRSGDNKDAVTTVTLTFSTITESGVIESSAVFIMPTLSNLEPGTKMRGESLKSVSSAWQELPLPGSPVMDAVDTAADESRVVPVAVTATIAETDRGNGQAMFVALTEALNSSKSDLGKIVTDAVADLE